MKFEDGPDLPEGQGRGVRDPNELGHPAPISFVMGRNEILAIGITGFICYSNGFEFRLIAVLATLNNRLSPLRSLSDQLLAHLTGQQTLKEPIGFRLRISFADGSTANSTEGRDPRRGIGDHTGPTVSLTLLQGGFDGLRCDLHWFVSPLPPPGPMLFDCVGDEA